MTLWSLQLKLLSRAIFFHQVLSSACDQQVKQIITPVESFTFVLENCHTHSWRQLYRHYKKASSHLALKMEICSFPPHFLRLQHFWGNLDARNTVLKAKAILACKKSKRLQFPLFLKHQVGPLNWNPTAFSMYDYLCVKWKQISTTLSCRLPLLQEGCSLAQYRALHLSDKIPPFQNFQFPLLRHNNNKSVLYVLH